jgi:hypothetical protein
MSSYLEGCTAPMRDRNQLHAAVVELVASDDAQIRYATVQNWYPGTRRAAADIQLRDETWKVSGPEFKDFMDTGRDRICDYLEVSRLHSHGRQLDR